MSPTCPRCTRRMEEGFVVDSSDGGSHTIGAWHRGKPDRRWWGLRVPKSERLEITACRCTGCGLLEQYAAGISSR